MDKTVPSADGCIAWNWTLFSLLVIGAGCYCSFGESVISLPGITAAQHSGWSPLTLLTMTSPLSVLTNPWPFVLCVHSITLTTPLYACVPFSPVSILFTCLCWQRGRERAGKCLNSYTDTLLYHLFSTQLVMTSNVCFIKMFWCCVAGSFYCKLSSVIFLTRF